MRIKPHVPLFDILMNFIIDLTVDGPAEEKHFDAACAVGSGYSESKWVCEQLLATAAERTAAETHCGAHWTNDGFKYERILEPERVGAYALPVERKHRISSQCCRGTQSILIDLS